MQELSWRARGSRILLDVSILRPGDPADLTSLRATALVDTGATVSGIGPRVIEQLGLSSYGKNRLKSATDETFVAYFLFRIGFDVPTDVEDGAVLPGIPFIFEELDGFSWSRPADFDVIMGMDVLSQCDLEMRRGGYCTLRFG